MAVHETAGLDRKRRAVCRSRCRLEIGRVLQCVRAVELAMMEVSYWNGLQILQYSSFPAHCGVVQLIRVGRYVELIAEVVPRNLGPRVVTDVLHGRRRNGERSIIGFMSVNALLPLPK